MTKIVITSLKIGCDRERGCVLSQELYFLAISYSLPGTVLPKKKLENWEYAVACLVPGTVHFKKEVLISEWVMVNFTLMVY